MNKWLVGLACVGMLAVSALNAAGGLILSQYYEGASNDKWLEIYNPGPDPVDLAAGGYRLGLWSNAAREAWKTNGTPTYSAALTGTIAAGGTFLYAHTNAVNPTYATWNMGGTVAYFNGDDTPVLYTGETYDFANVVDAFGLTNTTTTFGINKSFVRANTVTTGVNTDYNEADWIVYATNEVDAAAAGTNERLGYHSTGAATFGVFFDKSSGFEVVEGATDAITATAANGTEPYEYMWTSTLGGAYYSANGNVFDILATAPIGDYSATVTVSDDAAQTVSNTVSFSVVAPAVLYAITINPATNGTVTTTPATEAEEGQTVTITTTGAAGYVVDTISVVGEDSTPIGTSSTFVMPAQAVTITVTFKEAPAGRIVISQYTETDSGTIPKGIEIWNVSGADITFDASANLLDVKVGANGGAASSQVTANSGTLAAGAVWVIGTTNMNPDLVEPFTFNGDDAVVLELGGIVQDVIGTVGVDPGASWTNAGVSTANQNIQLKAGITTGDLDGWTDPSERFEYIAAGSDLEGFGVAPGGAVFGVTFDQTSGFTIEQGTSDVITATAANGTEPYGYVWSSTLDGAYYQTNAGAFTILATAPAGDYSAQVVATDSSDPVQVVTNGLNFSVTAPVVKYAIGIVTNAPENGTVTTTPATEAAEGATVTVNASAAGGYAVDTITVVDADLGEVTVTGNTFTMPAKAVTVTVTFAVHAGGALIISQYYEGSGNNKWIEIYNPGATAVDLGADGYRLGTWNNAAREGWKTNGTPTLTVVLSNSLAPGATYLVSYTTVSNPVYATANQTANLQFNGDDSIAIFTGTPFDSANVADVFGVTSNIAADKSFVRSTSVTAGINADYNAADWVQFTLAEVEAAGVAANERLGYHSTGPAVFGVTFDKTSGFTVEQGTSDSVFATAANGIAPYTYGWTSSLGGTYFTADSNRFTILSTAPTGSYSATTVATDSDTPAKSVTNSVNFSVVAPAVKYGISIVTNAPENGTVTTTPATEAAAGATVTIQIAPAEGYRAASVEVNGGAVAVVNDTFTMPAEPATVTVTFEVYDAPDVLIDFETNTTLSGSAYTAGTSTVNDVSFAHQRVLRGSLANDRVHGVYSGRFYPQTGTNAFLYNVAAFAEPITKINFWHANYGTDNGTTFKVQVSPDGATWEDVGSVVDPESTTLTEVVLESIPANATYVQFVTVTGTARVSIDDIGLYFGVPTLSVSANRTNGFVVMQGASDAITATAANGTAPYGYGWTSTLGGAYYSASSNVFTILATAPTGSYSATVTATDAVLATAQKTVTFRVNAVDTNAPAVVVSGSLSGTLAVQMDLTITLQNETASEWYIDLKDPDGLDEYVYNFDDVTGAFSFTPSKVGNYVLTATAVTGSGNVSNVVQLAISSEAAPVDIPPVALATNNTGNFRFTVPGGYTFNRVIGANTTVITNALVFSNLIPGVHYTVAGSNVTILTIPGSRQIIRMGVNPE